MSPRAPLRDTAVGTPFDSARMTAAMKAGSTLCSFAAAREDLRANREEEEEREILREGAERAACASGGLGREAVVVSGDGHRALVLLVHDALDDVQGNRHRPAAGELHREPVAALLAVPGHDLVGLARA